ncbi:hypothetical protein EIN_359450 [Entamoeba invadens IP1]|uniref:Uncharacterized protein n=1 Tax=Entamoeba invadens IP1 TaxID=370355 RepID=A0A0A1U7P4_ENTIV|nr:hypothetical protein EIN_359450 [Entamoeba invadens IP1]ELP90862.1 hypothetical protein EIN_359450 [Entamoeba invadens IP1]|eukprot:XP_004257633.1 hypothetical protein EIN_359450 [Entamoeba invadens IP1]
MSATKPTLNKQSTYEEIRKGMNLTRAELIYQRNVLGDLVKELETDINAIFAENIFNEQKMVIREALVCELRAEKSILLQQISLYEIEIKEKNSLLKNLESKIIYIRRYFDYIVDLFDLDKKRMMTLDEFIYKYSEITVNNVLPINIMRERADYIEQLLKEFEEKVKSTDDIQQRILRRDKILSQDNLDNFEEFRKQFKAARYIQERPPILNPNDDLQQVLEQKEMPKPTPTAMVESDDFSPIHPSEFVQIEK